MKWGIGVVVLLTAGAFGSVSKTTPSVPLERTPGHQKGLAEKALRERAKDPDAVQFRNERMIARGDTLFVCGEFNSRNSYGGYAGFTPFAYSRGVVVTGEDQGSAPFLAVCR
jgi:hypothetical protein